MEKKITVYVVKHGEVAAPFTTKNKANEAVALLIKFGLEAELTKETRTVTL